MGLRGETPRSREGIYVRFDIFYINIYFQPRPINARPGSAGSPNAADIFDIKCLEALRVIALQPAISLGNADLYANL